MCGFRFPRLTCFITDKPQGVRLRARCARAEAHAQCKLGQSGLAGKGCRHHGRRCALPTGPLGFPQHRWRQGDGRSTPSARSLYRSGGIHAARSWRRRLVVAFAEQARLRQGEPQLAHVALAVGAAIGRHQPIPEDRPAVPAVQQAPKLPGPQQPQQAHCRPRHAATSGVPVPDGSHANAQIGRRRLPVAQQAAMPKLAETFRTDEPLPPGTLPRADRFAGFRRGRGGRFLPWLNFA